jgi:hypothetical protein
MERTAADSASVLYCTVLLPSEKRRLKNLSWKELLLIPLLSCTVLLPSEKKTTEELVMERTVADFPLVLSSILADQ